MSVQLVQTYSYHNQLIDVPIVGVPKISSATRKIFKDELPPNWCTCPTIADKYSSLDKNKNRLLEIRDNGAREKAIACLKTAALVAFLAAGVLSIVAFTVIESEILIPLGIFGLVAYMIACTVVSCSTAERIKEIEQKEREWELPTSYHVFALDPTAYAKPIFDALGAGLIAPIFEVLTRESRLEDACKRQSEAIDKLLLDLKTGNEKIFPKAIEFYEQNAQSLLSRLEKEILDAQAEIERRLELPAYSQTGLVELQQHIDNCQQAMNEVSAVAAFYQRFK